MISLKDLDEDHVVGADVLDVVGFGLGDLLGWGLVWVAHGEDSGDWRLTYITTIASVIIEGLGHG